VSRLASASVVLLAAACSGGNGGPSAAPPPSLTVTVDHGPGALATSDQAAANILYATITICTPGSTTQCQDVDHVQVDTGSTGLRLVHEALSGVVTPSPVVDARSGLPIFECAVFADGYTWGSVVRADVVLVGRRIPGLVLEVIGDPAAGTAPAGCSGGSGPDEGTVAALGANGILGVGVFLQDCGPFCAAQIPSSGAAPYEVCSEAGTADASCRPTTVAIEQQVSNPVGLLPSENNGLQIQLPLPASPGAASVNGTLVLGLETSDANRLGSATLLPTDPGAGTLTTTYAGQSLDQSVIDSGSSGYYFPDSSIAVCAGSDPGNGFYCPNTAVSGNATIAGGNGAQSPVSFTVANANELFREGPSDSAFPDLAGPLPGSALSGRTFDWGLPFHFGRTVSILLEQRTAGGVNGPAMGF
jgi:Protein of unknown function (DUF3443)